MSIEELVVEKVRKMNPEQQQKVLEFMDSIKAGPQKPEEYRSPEGLWAGMGFDLTEEDIDAARKEMWRGFPRNVEL